MGILCNVDILTCVCMHLYLLNSKGIDVVGYRDFQSKGSHQGTRRQTNATGTVLYTFTCVHIVISIV